MLVRPLVGPSVVPLVCPHDEILRNLLMKFAYVENWLCRDCFEKRRRKRKSADVENWLCRKCFAPGDGCPFLLVTINHWYYCLTLSPWSWNLPERKRERGPRGHEGINREAPNQNQKPFTYQTTFSVGRLIPENIFNPDWRRLYFYPLKPQPPIPPPLIRNRSKSQGLQYSSNFFTGTL
jgi:hypothetical protein